ncbi:Plug domain-containing protein [Belliella sp. DSM 111904]|uniref:Plug domain-containing protein n=1 Tax=Belliella filtrata TaxID=2923435 RepID=A0ABS9V5P3_9BACT|nr:Plug domain-containing protein [Belliella filtrata]MCH7411278.1 Plug domain-containing protein [Belliella filtrata]
MKKLVLIVIIGLLSLSIHGQSYLWEESVYVHLSKDIFSVGEPVAFSMIIDSSDTTFTPSTGYIEIADRNGIPVYQAIVPLIKGQNTSLFILPSQIKSDNYLLRAYSRSSPFTSKKGVYNQFVTIINPDKPPVSKEKIGIKTTNTEAGKNKSLINKKEFTKNEEFELDHSVEEIISISLKNPFLEDQYQGHINENIYKVLNQNLKITEPWGHVIHAKNNSKNLDKNYYISAHGEQNYFNQAKPNLDDEMFFDLGPFKSFTFLLTQSEDQASYNDMEIIPPFIAFEFLDQFNIPHLNIDLSHEKFLESLLLAGQVESYFYKPLKIEGKKINTQIFPDKTYYLDDYNRFENVEITFKEYIPEVHVRKSDKQTIFKVINASSGNVFQNNPLILIDNLPIFDSNAFADFDPKNIERIEIVTRSFFFNNHQFSGAISLTSKNGAFGGFSLPEKALYLDYYQILPSIQFHQQSTDVKTNYPDFRSLLLWKSSNQSLPNRPIISTSNISGKYQIKKSVRKGQAWEVITDWFEVK